MRANYYTESHHWQNMPLTAIAAARLSRCIELDISCLYAGTSQQCIYLYLFEQQLGHFTAVTDAIFCQFPFDQLPEDAPLLLEQEPDMRPSEVRFVLESEQVTADDAIADIMEQLQEIFVHTQNRRYRFQCITGQHQNMTAVLADVGSTTQPKNNIVFRKRSVECLDQGSLFLINFGGRPFRLMHSQLEMRFAYDSSLWLWRVLPSRTNNIQQNPFRARYIEDPLLMIEDLLLLAHYRFPNPLDQQPWDRDIARVRALHQSQKNMQEMQKTFASDARRDMGSDRLHQNLPLPDDSPRPEQYALYNTAFPEEYTTHKSPSHQKQSVDQDHCAWETFDHAGFEVAELCCVFTTWNSFSHYCAYRIYIYKTFTELNPQYILQSSILIITHPPDTFQEHISNDYGILGIFSSEKDAYEAIDAKFQEKNLLLQRYSHDGIRYTLFDTNLTIFFYN